MFITLAAECVKRSLEYYLVIIGLSDTRNRFEI